MAAKRSAIERYNATIAAIRKSTGVSRKEAQQTYRTAAVRLGRAPTAKDAKTAAVAEGAARAGAQLRARERAKEKRIADIVAKVREGRKDRKGTVTVKPPPVKQPPPRRGGPGADRGGGGGGAVKVKVPPHEEPAEGDYEELYAPVEDERDDRESP